MKISIDINHPAHVHFFKNFIWNLKKKGHDVLITASDKDVTYALLDELGFQYCKMGRYGKSIVEKFVNIPVMNSKMWTAVKDFCPDVFVGLASVRAAHTAFLMRKKCFNFDDTENGTAELKLYLPFVHRVCTPSCYKKEIGPKQIRYPGYHELAYLHPNYFKPDPAILSSLGVGRQEKFVIMRFVSWQAVHDVGHQGITLENKRKAVEEFSRHAKVFITSEAPLPKDLEPYKIKIPSSRIHHALYYASLFYGESATMASECAILGTPAIYLDDDGRGYTDEEEQLYGSVFNFTESFSCQERSIARGVELLCEKDVKNIWREKSEKLLKDKIDVTAWMEALVLNENERVTRSQVTSHTCDL